jgi:hypothetical protein
VHYLPESVDGNESLNFSLLYPQKSREILKGVQAIEELKYHAPCSRILGGVGQTMLSSAYDSTIEWIYYPFDKSEDFELSDGGQITLDYKGTFDGAA